MEVTQPPLRETRPLEPGEWLHCLVEHLTLPHRADRLVDGTSYCAAHAPRKGPAE